MRKEEIKKTCNKCGREHYDNRSCVKKIEDNTIYKLIEEKKIYK